MPAKSIIGGWRAFSTTIQDDISSPETVNTRLNFEGQPMAPSTNTDYVNEDEITGEVMANEHILLNKKFEGVHATKLFPHVVGLFAAPLMGADAPALVTDATRHILTVDNSVVEVPTRTMVENNGNTQRLYPGVATRSFTISGKRGELMRFEAELIGRGGEEADATGKPARLVEPYMTYKDCNMTSGGTYDGDVVTGGSSLSPDLKEFSFKFTNNAAGEYLFGDTSGLVGSIRRGQNYQVEFSAALEIHDTSHRDAWLAGDEFVLEIPIVGGPTGGGDNYEVRIILPRVYYKDVEEQQDNGIIGANTPLQVLSDSTHGAVIIEVINLHSADYLAT